jgi:hypothetical protein
MAACRPREVADFESRVFPQALADRADPGGGLALGPPVCSFQELSKRGAQGIFAGVWLARPGEAACLPGGGGGGPPPPRAR